MAVEGQSRTETRSATYNQSTEEVSAVGDRIVTRSVSSELYRRVDIDCDHVDSYHHETVFEKIEPDDVVQAITDASLCEHGNVYTHVILTDIRTTMWCDGSPKFAALLNALRAKKENTK